MTSRPQANLRNIALIAHVDHGKTTLVDGLLKQARVFHARQVVGERILDTNELERERGITILAKNTAIRWGGVKINIVDTPGHSDFGGEVERVLYMVDGVLLLVDAVEGPMPQTRFVLRKALARGLRAVVVVNKMDRPAARPEWVVDRTFDLFVDLGASDDQADFRIVYTDALTGRAGIAPDDLAPDLGPLFDAILTLPPPMAAPEAPLQMLVTTLDYDDYVGRLAVGRLAGGRLRPGQEVAVATPGGAPRKSRSADVYVFENLKRTAVEEAGAGDIAAVAGLGNVMIGETITSPEEPRPLPPIAVEAPTVRMTFMVNTSPFAGREGRYASSRVLRDRLHREAERNVAMRVADTDTPDAFVVSGRGELHLAILVETMRREGHEFAVGRPEVIVRAEDGRRSEPFEDAYIDVAEEYVGAAVELLGARRGVMLEMDRGAADNMVSIRYRAPTRGLIGLRNRLLTATKGTAVLHRVFHGYGEWAGGLPARDAGSIVAHVTGITTKNALKLAEERGELFVGPREEVYAGQVVGSTTRGTDLVFNVCRKKHLTNHRRSFAEDGIFLSPPVKMGVDEAIGYVGDDELVEATPAGVRLRKRDLDHDRRLKSAKRKARASAG